MSSQLPAAYSLCSPIGLFVLRELRANTSLDIGYVAYPLDLFGLAQQWKDFER